ncbi:hypothetical protein ABDB91_15605 [Desulfoscipio sp. XC116]
MSKTVNYPTEAKDADVLTKRIKKDLTWVVISMAVAFAAAAGTYMILTK